MIRPIIGANFNSYNLNRAPNFKGEVRLQQNTQPQETFANSSYYRPESLDFYGSRAKAAIGAAIEAFGIDKNKIKTVCDFGCGSGRPTTVLKEIFGPDCDVIGIDQIDRYFEPDKETTFKCCNGMEYLRSGERKFDLIAAQMLDPAVNAMKFLKAASKSLNEDGQLLIYSDYITMGKLVHTIYGSGVLKSDDYQLTEMPKGQLKIYGNWTKTLLISKEKLDKLMAQ